MAIISGMSGKRALGFVLGLWCGATVFMWMTAMGNFRVVETILGSGHEQFFETAGSIETSDLRLLMRYQASEVNRILFDGWGMVQLPIAVLVVVLARWGGAGKFVLISAGLMLLIALFLQSYVVPETLRLGRIIDFVPRDPEPPEAAQFWVLHHTYTALDMLKFLLGAASAASLCRTRAVSLD